MSDNLSLRSTTFAAGAGFLASYATSLRNNDLLLGRNFWTAGDAVLDGDDVLEGVTWAHSSNRNLYLLRQIATGADALAMSSPIRATWHYSDQSAAPASDSRVVKGDLYVEDTGSGDPVLFFRDATPQWLGVTIRATYRTAAVSNATRQASSAIVLRCTTWPGSHEYQDVAITNEPADIPNEFESLHSLRIAKARNGGSRTPIASLDDHATLVLFETSKTISNDYDDDNPGGIVLSGGYTAASAKTVVRHNYITAPNLTIAGSAAVTDACLVRFDAAAGTHKAVASGTTKATPGGVDAWILVNVNGTIHYLPAYTSKTA